MLDLRIVCLVVCVRGLLLGRGRSLRRRAISSARRTLGGDEPFLLHDLRCRATGSVEEVFEQHDDTCAEDHQGCVAERRRPCC